MLGCCLQSSSPHNLQILGSAHILFFFKVLDLPSPHSLLGILVLTLGLYSQGFPSPHPLTAQPAQSLCAQTPAGRVLAGMLSLLWPTGADMDWKLRNVSLETPTFEVGSRKTSGLFSFLFLVHTDPTLSGTRMWTVSHSLHNWDYTAVFGVGTAFSWQGMDSSRKDLEKINFIYLCIYSLPHFIKLLCKLRKTMHQHIRTT